jgi:hypothetical protein
MLSSERRLSALEVAANAVDDELKVICLLPGETEETAASKAGYPPHVSQRMRIVFVSPTDELL